MALKVTKKSEKSPWVLFNGDIIEVGVSHELKIDKEATWVSYKIASKVQEGETAQQAHERVVSTLLGNVKDTIGKVVAQVEEMSE